MHQLFIMIHYRAGAEVSVCIVICVTCAPISTMAAGSQYCCCTCPLLLAAAHVVRVSTGTQSIDSTAGSDPHQMCHPTASKSHSTCMHQYCPLHHSQNDVQLSRLQDFTADKPAPATPQACVNSAKSIGPRSHEQRHPSNEGLTSHKPPRQAQPHCPRIRHTTLRRQMSGTCSGSRSSSSTSRQVPHLTRGSSSATILCRSAATHLGCPAPT
jgi:hypothetical protein